MGEAGSEKLTVEQAVALLREHAFTEESERDYAAAEEFVEMAAMVADELKAAGFHVLAVRALEVQAELTKPGRAFIHCRMGGLGADWNLDEAIKLAEAADEIAWIDSWLGHNLGVIHDGMVHAFDVARPADG